VRNRRKNGRRVAARGRGPAGALAGIGLRFWARAGDNPVDSMAILSAGAASLIVIVNAVFLQSGPHPAPFVVNPNAPAQVAESRTGVAVMAMPRPADVGPARPAAGVRTPQTVSNRRNDPIADLIASSADSSARVVTVQRVLSEFGYGQLRSSGTLDRPTSAAIEKFENDHKMPVTGRLSDRLLNELSAMTGRPIE